jgi:hypothetical protein
MMNIKNQNSLPILLLLALSALFSGCTSTAEEMRTREALVILIQKVERLEKLHHIHQNTTDSSNIQYIPLYAKKQEYSMVLNRLPAAAIKLHHCDKFGWCRVSGSKGYVQKWLVVKAR